MGPTPPHSNPSPPPAPFATNVLKHIPVTTQPCRLRRQAKLIRYMPGRGWYLWHLNPTNTVGGVGFLITPPLATHLLYRLYSMTIQHGLLHISLQAPIYNIHHWAAARPYPFWQHLQTRQGTSTCHSCSATASMLLVGITLCSFHGIELVCRSRRPQNGARTLQQPGGMGSSPLGCCRGHASLRRRLDLQAGCTVREGCSCTGWDPQATCLLCQSTWGVWLWLLHQRWFLEMPRCSVRQRCAPGSRGPNAISLLLFSSPSLLGMLQMKLKSDSSEGWNNSSHHIDTPSCSTSA